MTTNSGVLPPAPLSPPTLRRAPVRPDARRRGLAIDRERAALLLLLALTAVAYLWDLSASGYANNFYSAAVQAATKSWKAFFFGSIDSSNYITVDKPPASLWVMALSGRIFGFDSLSMLVPQVLEGVAAVALLYASIRRWFGARAGLAAGALLAITPVAALMFRFNNPDALLVLALVAGAYCLTRALERAGTRWVLAAGAMIGVAFLAKMMQAFLVLPAFALVYMLAAPTGLRRRTLQTVAGGAAIVLSAGWWVAIVALWPASSRPSIDGSSTNSIINLILGYNGLGRIFGAGGPGGGGGGGANFSGSTGILRLFNSVMGGQASWLLPAALLVLVGGLAFTRRAGRTDRTRAALLLWGGWLVISALVFSLGSGVIHTYYTVALAPAIAALVAIGGRMLWERRERRPARTLAALAMAATAAWAYILLARTPSWQPWLRTLVLGAGVVGTAGMLALAARPSVLRPRWMRRGLATAIAVACLAGPVAYTVQTLHSAHTGSTPSAGPAVADARGPGGGLGAGAGRPGTLVSRSGASAGGPPSGFPGASSSGSASSGSPASTAAASRARSAGGPGGDQLTVSAALKSALTSGSSGYRWAAATSGSQSAASLELATGGAPVMAIGGFNNQAKTLTLAEFQAYVSQHAIHYYLAAGSGAGAGPGGGSNDIASWVAAHFTKVTIGGQVLYDLSSRR
jgi:4-amino-4-deoxy-L-arabinose transferase-like glycosyltransferase